jgi:MFS family permease
MAMKPGDSHSSVEKEGVHHSTIGKAAHKIHLGYPPQAPAADKDGALARKAFLKFDLILVLPMLVMFCKWDIRLQTLADSAPWIKDLLSFIDRVNIGNARVAGLQADLKMSNYQYSLALTMTYIPYIIVEIPASLVLKRVGANILLPTMVILWGLTTALQGFVTSYRGLIAARFFLGLFEGGLLPGITLVMSRFYKRDQIQLRMTLLFTAGSLAGAFSGLLASGILEMNGRAGHKGWQWIFILVCNRLHSSPCFRALMKFVS